MAAAKSKKFEETTKEASQASFHPAHPRQPGALRPQTLSEKFNTTERNFYMDMNDLNASGFAITYDKPAGTYRFTDPDFTLRDLDLNKDELMSLLIGRQVASKLGKPFEKSFLSILKKVKKDTGSWTRDRYRGDRGEGRFWIDIDDAESFESVERRYKALNEALDKKVTVEILYSAMETEEETTIVVSPYGLIFKNGLSYSIGYCHLRNEIRVFALDRIKEIKLTAKDRGTARRLSYIQGYCRGHEGA